MQGDLRLVLHLREALAAVNGTVFTGLEGDLRFGAAGSAGRDKHLPLSFGAVLTGSTALLASLGLVLKASPRIDLLLAGGKNKPFAAVRTSQGFFFYNFLTPRLG